MEIFFPEATQPSWKITEIPSRRGGGGVWQAPPGKQKCPPGGDYGYFLELNII